MAAKQIPHIASKVGVSSNRTYSNPILCKSLVEPQEQWIQLK